MAQFLQPTFDHQGESCTSASNGFCFRETNLERVYISLSLSKAPWPVLRQTTQLNLSQPGEAHTWKLWSALCPVLDLETEGGGNFEKEGKDTQGMHKHGLSGFILELVFSLKRSRESGNTAWLFVPSKSFEP